MSKKLSFTIATIAALSSGLLLPLAAEAKSRTAAQHRAAASQSTITNFSSSSAPTLTAPTSSLNVGVNHPAKNNGFPVTSRIPVFR
jgi:hypothetical protein